MQSERVTIISACGGVTIGNGEVIYHTDANYNATAEITCNDGYERVGTGFITCLETGLWDTAETNCTIRDCGTDFTLDNGVVNFTDVETKYGHSAPVRCNNGYEPIGGSRIECLSSGSWSIVTCEIIACGGVTIGNGEVIYHTDAKYNATAEITCNDGYERVGTGFITCLETGLWDTAETNCTIRDCGTDLNLDNGVVNFTDVVTKYGHSAPVSCNNGYESIGGSRIECLSSGSWSTVTCEIIACGGVTVGNGQVTYQTNTDYNMTATIVCNDGYELVGTGLIKCSVAGLWDTSDTNCIIKDCGTNYTLNNGFAYFTDMVTTYGHSVPVICNAGYEPVGGSRIECLSTGNWSTVTCETIDCSQPIILNGKAEVVAGTGFMAEASIKCNAGYHVEGTGKVVCQENGQWSSNITCEINDCGQSKTILNGHVDLATVSTTYGSSVPVTCDTGFKLSGGTKIQCQEDGTWSDTVTCEIIDCGAKNLANGEVQFSTGTTYGAHGFVTCNGGYRVDGLGVITCLVTGVWSNTTKCLIKDCGKEKTIPNGHVDLSAAVTTYGSTVAVVCDTGYTLTGGTKIECLADGVWSDTVTCEEDGGAATTSDSATGVDFDTVLILGLMIGGLFLIDIIVISVVVYLKRCRPKRLDHSPIDESEFCEEPVRKEKLPEDEGTFIESPRFTDAGVPTILLTHPPPSTKEALPPIRTFQQGLAHKDVNVVPPFPKKLPPVPDDIKIPQSLRPVESNVSEKRPDFRRDQEPVPSTSGVTTTNHTDQAVSDLEQLNVTVEKSDTTMDLGEPEMQSAAGLPEPSNLPRELIDQMRESSTIAAPATVIIANEARDSKGKTKSAASKTTTAKQKGKTLLKQEKSSLLRAPKSAASKTPAGQPSGQRSFRAEASGKTGQTPRLKSDLTSVSLAKVTPNKVDSKLDKTHSKQELINSKESEAVAEEKFLEPSKIMSSLESSKGDTDAMQGRVQNLSLENDLTIVSTANEDCMSTSHTETISEKERPVSEYQKSAKPKTQTKDTTGLLSEAAKLEGTENRYLSMKAGGTDSTHIIHVGRTSPPPDRLPSRESTASISSTLDPVMPSVEAVDRDERTLLHNGVSKTREKQSDFFHDGDGTDYSSDSFSSDSEVELPDNKTTKRPQPFFLEAEISHIPLEHPRSPFPSDNDPRTRFSSAATQRRAMSSRLLTSSYGTRPNVQVQAYNPLAEAKQTKQAERQAKKAKVATEKADAKKKGRKRLKAMKSAYGSLRMPQRR